MDENTQVLLARVDERTAYTASMLKSHLTQHREDLSAMRARIDTVDSRVTLNRSLINRCTGGAAVMLAVIGGIVTYALTLGNTGT